MVFCIETVLYFFLIPCVIKLLKATKSVLPASFSVISLQNELCHSFTRPLNQRNLFIHIHTHHFSPSPTHLPTHRCPLIGRRSRQSVDRARYARFIAPKKLWKPSCQYIDFFSPKNKSNKVINRASGFVLNSVSFLLFAGKKDTPKSEISVLILVNQVIGYSNNIVSELYKRSTNSDK